MYIYYILYTDLYKIEGIKINVIHQLDSVGLHGVSLILLQCMHTEIELMQVLVC